MVDGGTVRRLDRNGISLHCSEWGSGDRTLLFIHGLGCNHRYFEPQVRYFSTEHRVVAVDLRGHGVSEGTVGPHAFQEFASDVAWQCAQLELERMVVVGHSMGGVVAAHLTVGASDLVSAVVFLDSALMLPPDRLAAMRTLAAALRGPNFRAALRTFADGLFSPWDDVERRRRIVEDMASTPQQVAASVVSNVIDWRREEILPRCHVPALYIAARHRPEFPQIQELYPAMAYGQVVGAGHFPHLDVPEQVNPMIERFLRMHNLHPASGRDS